MILAFLVAQTIGLIALYGYSRNNNGILPVSAKYHQLWKYGPTGCKHLDTFSLC